MTIWICIFRQLTGYLWLVVLTKLLRTSVFSAFSCKKMTVMFWVKCFHILAWIRLCCCSGQELGSRSHFQKSNQKSSQPWWDAAELLPAPAKVLHADGARWLLVSVESFYHHWEDKYPYFSFSIVVMSRWCSGRDASSVMCALLEASSLVIWKMGWSPEWADGLSGASLGGF